MCDSDSYAKAYIIAFKRKAEEMKHSAFYLQSMTKRTENLPNNGNHAHAQNCIHVYQALLSPSAFKKMCEGPGKRPELVPRLSNDVRADTHYMN